MNEAGDGLPALAIDVYGEHAVVQLHAGADRDGSEARGEDASDPWARPERRARVLDAVHALGMRGLYLKLRPRQANLLVDTRREDLAPREPVRGEAAPDPLVVHEEGLPLSVSLGDGLSTGVFLDQRRNRRRVRELAGGKSVLNLFAYTCAFTVAAALGGARATTSVGRGDGRASSAGGRTSRLPASSTSPSRARTVSSPRTSSPGSRARPRRNERFDLVVCDPPSYSKTKKRRFVAASDYQELAALVLGLVTPHGALLACTKPPRHQRGRAFRKMLFDAARAARRDVASIRDLATPGDFPPAPGGESHLKSALVILA